MSLTLTSSNAARIRRFLIRRAPTHIARRNDVQGLRAIAVLMVVTFHADLPLPGGFAGVDVFFVISGFVITAMLLRELARTGRIDLKRFYVRRAKRLLPALAVTSIAIAAVAAIVQPPLGPQQEAAKTGIATALFSANVQIHQSGSDYFSTNAELNPFLHMWSLGVEEQFYFVFPTFLLAAWALSRALRIHRKKALAFAVAATSAVSLAACIMLTAHSETGKSLAFYMSPTRAWEFGAGALVAIFAARLSGSRPATGKVVALAGLALIAASAFLLQGTSAFPGYLALVPVAGAAFLIAAGSMGSNPVSTALSARPLVAIGDVSYGWYLWHWPAVVFTRELLPGNGIALVAVSVAALIPAFLSYRYIEEPLRQWKPARARRTIGLALACITAPAMCAAALGFGAQSSWGRSETPSLIASRMEQTFGREEGCHLAGSVKRSEVEQCGVTVPNAKGWVLLAGDSHADNLSDGVLDASRNLGYDFRQVTGSTCSFSPASARETSRVSNCGDVYEWVMQMATSEPKPSLVVVSHYGRARSQLPSGIEGVSSAEAWEANLQQSLGRLGDAGVPVLLVNDLPRIRESAEPCLFGSVKETVCQVSRAHVDAERAPGRAIEDRVTAALPNVESIDVTETFCDARMCDARRGNVMLYADNQHLTAPGSRALAPLLQPVMEASIGPNR
jgi:peptidoglycan/LPS O-acetylase OafA/YrhL